ncbi:glycosyltransferase [Ideonella sp.]|uniref:glycosyltransferase n=1 Tax=Ideonella sp. TaxID=1929293 RepID=UPI003BB65EE8
MNSDDDLAQLYRAFLGREIEPEVVQRAKPRPLLSIMLEMAGSDEVSRRVLHGLVQQRPLPHRRLAPATLAPLSAWIESRLGVPPSFPDEPQTVPFLLGRLYAQPAVAARMLKQHGSLFTQALEELKLLQRAGRYNLVGKIEFANREFIAGWAQDEAGLLETPQLEVRLEGRVIASAGAYSYRPDIHQHHGGTGLAGFRAAWDPSQLPFGQALTFTLHEASTGVQLGPPYRFENNFFDQLSVAQRLAKELDELRRRLDVLAGMVPQALSYAAFPLEHFDLYRRTHRVAPPVPTDAPLAASPAGAIRCTVLLDASAGDPIAVRRSVDALRSQALPHWQVWVVGDDPRVVDVAALLGAGDPRVGHQRTWADAEPGLIRLPQADEADWVLLLEAGELLDAQTLPWIRHAAGQTTAVALYWDEDRLEHLGGRAPARETRHVEPVLRCAFDPDAMLELNVVGSSFAVRGSALVAAMSALQAHPLPSEGALPAPHALSLRERERLVWALLGQGELHHLPHFLLSRTQASTDEASSGAARWVARATPEQLNPLLPPDWRARSWQRVADPLAEAAPKPVVRWEPENAQALISVLLPTRDYGDLVRQCVDSLRALARRPHRLEILIADNGSTDPETLSYLAQGQAEGLFRVLRIDEPFNWSRLNNQMAAAATGELLLVLNNDTRMLTKHWDDALRGLLERPEVGAVGARLLYEDMTLQHAGVMFGFEGFVGHEANHRPHDDAGALTDSQLSRRVSAATGAFLGCRKAVFEELGGFEAEQLSVTFNDVDWCVRLRATGRSVIYAPLLSMIHYESKSRGFDFMSVDKQRRAEYEQQCLMQRSPLGFARDELRSGVVSGWLHSSVSLK